MYEDAGRDGVVTVVVVVVIVGAVVPEFGVRTGLSSELRTGRGGTMTGCTGLDGLALPLEVASPVAAVPDPVPPGVVTVVVAEASDCWRTRAGIPRS